MTATKQSAHLSMTTHMIMIVINVTRSSTHVWHHVHRRQSQWSQNDTSKDCRHFFRTETWRTDAD